MVGSLTEGLGVSWILAYQSHGLCDLCGLLGGKWYGGTPGMGIPNMHEVWKSKGRVDLTRFDLYIASEH